MDKVKMNRYNSMDVLVGLGAGDEAKSKITDMLAENYDIVARYQGGANSGHTLFHKGNKIVLHLIPSGIIHLHTKNFLGNGMVIDPYQLMLEIEEIEGHISNIRDRIYISEKAHIVTPYHLLEDKENLNTIGSTGKGIGPCYRDKVYRKGKRVIDFIDCDLSIEPTDMLGKDEWEFENFENFRKGIEFMKTLNIVPSNWLRNQEGTILAEGAQGMMLDIEHGTYPYVTSSTTISSGAATGLAMPPQSIKRVYGVSKAYLTRVGNGEFVTELSDENGTHIQTNGKEFGATTGRPRRCGWLNLDELKESIELNGVTDLIMTKVDVLENMEHVELYSDGEYHSFTGWKKSDLSDNNLVRYINFIEKKLDKKIDMISISPEREGIIVI